ncbi:acyl transferase/acyl hydrolase/lysophospholipase [Dichotomocladium elegans]|nr:acyl transferase/acyl hydrolase/lysophospholipase [Dichotomocladium elegans]
MMYMFRGGLHRNFGGICDKKLFTHSYLGTKTCIEDYMEEMVAQIEYIESTDTLDQQAKMKFFSDARQGFGSSALVLQGGTAFALYHLGVLKALHEQGLLPRIISGNAVGAMIAALICIHTDEELPTILKPDGIDLRAFSQKTDKGHVRRRITRFLKHGYLMDMKVLQQCVRTNVGDLTFEEAYRRSKRVLNISVSSSRKDIPPILNYLTAPNVLIWSAACCSTASVGLFGGCELLAKDTNGNIVKWSSSALEWNHWSEASQSDSEEPLKRLTELFNVNHFIVSQAMAYAIPFTAKAHNLQRETWWNKLAYVIASELKHRLYQASLDQLRILPSFFLPVIEDKISGNVTIAPDISLSDFNTLFSNPTHASIQYWILHGERSTWPLLSFIRTRCMIELALDKAILRLKAMNVERAPVVVTPPCHTVERKKRAQSMH